MLGMDGSQCGQAIPTKLSVEQFEQFVLPHLSRGRRGPPPTLSLHKLFNYILQALYMGCQWKMLPIGTNAKGLPEIHYTRIYRAFRRWQTAGCMDAMNGGLSNRGAITDATGHFAYEKQGLEIRLESNGHKAADLIVIHVAEQ